MDGTTGPGGKDLYVYFNNDAEAHAPRDAMRLKQKAGVACVVKPIRYCKSIEKWKVINDAHAIQAIVQFQTEAGKNACAPNTRAVGNAHLCMAR